MTRQRVWLFRAGRDVHFESLSFGNFDPEEAVVEPDADSRHTLDRSDFLPPEAKTRALTAKPVLPVVAEEVAYFGRVEGSVQAVDAVTGTICTPHSRPVIAAVRMRRGKAADSRVAPKFVSEALATAAEAGCTGTRILRADSQFYNAGVIAACRRAGTYFSITTGMNPSVKRAVLAIPDEAWQQISYPNAVCDPETGDLISDAEVAEIPAYTAFASRKKAERVTARLIVRRVRDLAKPAVVGEQG